MNPVVLLEKKRDGTLRPWRFQGKHKDGSLRVDVPLESLHIVSLEAPYLPILQEWLTSLIRLILILDEYLCVQLVLQHQLFNRLPGQPARPLILLPAPWCTRAACGTSPGPRVAGRIYSERVGTVHEDRAGEESPSQ
jgi:hypothetical protein